MRWCWVQFWCVMVWYTRVYLCNQWNPCRPLFWKPQKPMLMFVYFRSSTQTQIILFTTFPKHQVIKVPCIYKQNRTKLQGKASHRHQIKFATSPTFRYISPIHNFRCTYFKDSCRATENIWPPDQDNPIHLTPEPNKIESIPQLKSTASDGTRKAIPHTLENICFASVAASHRR